MKIKNLLCMLLCLVCVISILACGKKTTQDPKKPFVTPNEKNDVPSTTSNEGRIEDTTGNSVDFASAFVEITDYNLYDAQINDYILTDEYSEGLLLNTQIIQNYEALEAAAQAVSVDTDEKELEKYNAAFFEEKQLVALTVFFTKPDGVETEVGGVYLETTENKTNDYRVKFTFYKNNGPDGASSDQMCYHFRFVLIELDKNLNLNTDNVKLAW